MLSFVESLFHVYYFYWGDGYRSFYRGLRFKRECPRGPRENAKMWHRGQKMTTLIFRSEIPHDELINVVYLFCSDLLLFSRKFAKTVQDADNFRYGGH